MTLQENIFKEALLLNINSHRLPNVCQRIMRIANRESSDLRCLMYTLFWQKFNFFLSF